MVIISVLAFLFKAFVITSLIAGLISSIPSQVDAVVISDSVSPIDPSPISEDHPTGADSSVVVAAPDATLPVDSICGEFDAPTIDYSALTIRQLKALCKERGIKRYSSLRKHELVELLQH